MDFLIKAYWYQADAAQAGHQADQRAGRSRRSTRPRSSEFTTAAAFKPFLSSPARRRGHRCSGSGSTQIFRSCSKRTRRPSRRPRSQLLHQRTSRSSARRRSATCGSCWPRPQANAQRRQGGAAERARAGTTVAKKYSIDPTTKDNGGLLNGVTAGEEDAALNKAAFAAPLNKLAGSGQGPVRLLRVRGHQDHAGDAADARAGDAADQADADRRSSRPPPRPRSTTRPRRTGSSRPRAATLYAMADCSATRRRRRRRTTGASRRATHRQRPHQRGRDRRRRRAPPSKSRRTAGRRAGARRGSTRSPAGCARECPWDREQDERTIVPHTVEEAYELADAAQRGDDAKLLDELGDVLFQVHFLALLLEERGAGDLAAGRRARDREADPPPSARVRRDRGRRRRRGAAQLGPDQAAPSPGREPGMFGEVPENLPGPLYARKVQRRAASSGFDFPGVEGPLQSVRDELDELEAAGTDGRALPRARRRPVRGGQRRAQAARSIPSWRCAPRRTGSAAASSRGDRAGRIRRAKLERSRRPTSSSRTTPAPA